MTARHNTNNKVYEINLLNYNDGGCNCIIIVILSFTDDTDFQFYTMMGTRFSGGQYISLVVQLTGR